jgi:hypothetical protein
MTKRRENSDGLWNPKETTTSPQAWQHMGLRVKPGADNVEQDLERARTAIDCIAFLVDKLKTHVQESEAKRLKNLLADLQINFVRISKT